MNHFNSKSSIATLVVLSSSVFLSACATSENSQLSKRVTQGAELKRDAVVAPLPGDGNIRGGVQSAERSAQSQSKPNVMKKATRSWVGSVMVPVNADDKLPATFSADYVIKFADGKGPLPLAVIAARLGQIVGIPVRVQQDVYQGGESLTVQSGSGPESSSSAVSAIKQSNLSAANMNWSGSLSGFLDNLTDQLGLSWEYRDGSIVIMRFTTEMYELATFPNGYNYNISSGASGSSSNAGGVSATSQLNVEEEGLVNGLDSMLKVIKKMIESVPGSEVLVADGSGRMVVKTSRDVQSVIREFIRAENANMLKQVQIQLDIYSVSTGNSDEFGVDWTAFYRNLMGNYSLGLTSPATLTGINGGSLSGVILPNGPSENNQRFGNTAAVINALNQVGSNVQHRPISLVALNRQWARKARLNTTGYLSETKPAVSGGLGGGSGLPGLTTSSITTGDQYAVMPYILENNTVMLKMGVSLSDLLDLFEVTTGSGETLQRVQTPNTSAISDQYTIALRPGEVMAVTGLSRDVSMNDRRTLAQGVDLAFGGSRTSSTRRENFIVFIRAILL